MRKTVIVSFLWGALLFASPLSADVLISNLSTPDASSTLFGPGSTTIFKAAGWTLPVGQDYFLDDITLQLNFNNLGQANVELWSGAGTPTTPIVTLNSPPQTGVGNFAFTPPSTQVLSSGETYWVYVTAQPGSTGNFNWIASKTAPSGIATNAGYIFNGSPSSFFNKYEVRGTLVPEPVSFTVTLLTICGFWGVRRYFVPACQR